MIRVVTFGFVVIATILAGSVSGQAYYEGPWCMKAIVGRAEHNICHFRTFEQCLGERSFWGGTAFCGQNPNYLPYRNARGPKPRRIQ